MCSTVWAQEQKTPAHTHFTHTCPWSFYSAQLSNYEKQDRKQGNSAKIHTAQISSSSHVLNVQTLNVPDPVKQVHLAEARFLDPLSPSNNTRRGKRHRLQGLLLFTKMSSGFVWLFFFKLGYRFWCTRLNWLRNGGQISVYLFVFCSRCEVGHK